MDEDKTEEFPVERIESFAHANRWCPRCKRQMHVISTEEINDPYSPGLHLTVMNWGCDCLSRMPDLEAEEEARHAAYLNRTPYVRPLRSHPSWPEPEPKPEEDLSAEQLMRRAYLEE